MCRGKVFAILVDSDQKFVNDARHTDETKFTRLFNIEGIDKVYRRETSSQILITPLYVHWLHSQLIILPRKKILYSGTNIVRLRQFLEHFTLR